MRHGLSTCTGAVRYKITASTRRGLWMAGSVPFGYQPNGRSLMIDEAGAPALRHIHALYLELGSVGKVADRALNFGYLTRVRVTAVMSMLTPSGR